CNYYSSSLSPNKELYVISLDLCKFYNNIDINSLVDELKYLYQEHYKKFSLQKEFKDEITFWEKVRAIFGWEWSEKDYNDNNNEIINDSKSSLGLPQGLVASGFFSNAYLIRFDRLVGNCIKRKLRIPTSRFLIIVAMWMTFESWFKQLVKLILKRSKRKLLNL